MIGLLLPSQTRVKDVITEKLDIDLIAQQAANNVLDVKAHALFIIDLMGKLCAPVRDEVIDIKTGRLKRSQFSTQLFLSENFRKYFIFFTCILPDYVADEITKEF